MLSIICGNADCKESDELTPEIRISEKIICNSSKNPGNDKDIGVIGSSPASDSLKGILVLAKDLLIPKVGWLLFQILGLDYLYPFRSCNLSFCLC